MVECAGEIRHRPLSFLFESHFISQLPTALVGLSTGIFQYGGTNQVDYRKLQELFAAYARVPYSRAAHLPMGRALAGFKQATDLLFTIEEQELIIRPSLVWTGGETVAVG